MVSDAHVSPLTNALYDTVKAGRATALRTIVLFCAVIVSGARVTVSVPGT